jgi:hypothetical protein
MNCISAAAMRGVPMPKNPPPPTCPKCRKPMHFMVVKTGGRKFRCIKCDSVDPMRMSDIQACVIDNSSRRIALVLLTGNRQTWCRKRCQTLSRRQKKSCERHRTLALTALRLARVAAASLRDLQPPPQIVGIKPSAELVAFVEAFASSSGAAPTRSPNTVPR